MNSPESEQRFSLQVYKEIVARNKTDDSYVTGTALRKILGIPLGDMKGKFKIDLSKIPDFDVFVQSTSYNRQLMPGMFYFFLESKIQRIRWFGFLGEKVTQTFCQDVGCFVSVLCMRQSQSYYFSGELLPLHFKKRNQWGNSL